jgi:hypothetical protein
MIKYCIRERNVEHLRGVSLNSFHIQYRYAMLYLQTTSDIPETMKQDSYNKAVKCESTKAQAEWPLSRRRDPR